MKRFLSLTLLLGTFVSSAAFVAQAEPCPGFTYPLAHGKRYLMLTAYKGELIELYSKPDFEGDAVMFLAKRGLFVDDKLLCSWAGAPDEQGFTLFDEKTPQDMVFEHCPVDSPVQATWADHGVGTAAVFIEFKERIKDYLIVNFRGQTMYLDMRDIPSTVHTQIYKFDANVNLEPENEPVQEWTAPGESTDNPAEGGVEQQPQAPSVDLKEATPAAPVNPTPEKSRDPELPKQGDAPPSDKKSENTPATTTKIVI